MLINFIKTNDSIYRVLSFDQFYGGSISEGSELQIEVAEFLWRNVEVLTSQLNYVN